MFSFDANSPILYYGPNETMRTGSEVLALVLFGLQCPLFFRFKGCKGFCVAYNILYTNDITHLKLLFSLPPTRQVTDWGGGGGGE